MTCPLCRGDRLDDFYACDRVPLFQNKVYRTPEDALAAPAGTVVLATCRDCGFVFNRTFDPALMNYDGEYQNEQGHSPFFDQYLDGVVDLLKQRGLDGGTTIEIGCGKGAFLKKLWDQGFDATGFDKTYEGSDPRVVKDYYTSEYSDRRADLYVLRHTLEHVHDPLDFLHGIAAAADYNGLIYIEVPGFEWIEDKAAFWDVFYEHCNYFSLNNLAGLFGQGESGTLFNGQYLFVIGELSTLKQRGEKTTSPTRRSGTRLHDELQRLQGFVTAHPGLIVWGAGAKGSTFVNITDPDRQWIDRVIDINPNKVGCYVACSGHPIQAPQSLEATQHYDILVMNENYLEEIRASMQGRSCTFHVLGESLV